MEASMPDTPEGDAGVIIGALLAHIRETQGKALRCASRAASS
jgi:hypothetical protein